MRDRYKEAHALMLNEGTEDMICAEAKCAKRTLKNAIHDRTRVGKEMGTRIVEVMIRHGYLTPQTTVANIFPRFAIEEERKSLPRSDPMKIERGSYAALLMDWIARGWTTADILKDTLEDKKYKFSGEIQTEKAFRQVIYNLEREK